MLQNILLQILLQIIPKKQILIYYNYKILQNILLQILLQIIPKKQILIYYNYIIFI